MPSRNPKGSLFIGELGRVLRVQLLQCLPVAFAVFVMELLQGLEISGEEHQHQMRLRRVLSAEVPCLRCAPARIAEDARPARLPHALAELLQERVHYVGRQSQRLEPGGREGDLQRARLLDLLEPRLLLSARGGDVVAFHQ